MSSRPLCLRILERPASESGTFCHVDGDQGRGDRFPWMEVSLALRMALTYPWDATTAWAEVREHIPWLLAEQSRIRRAGWFN